MKGKLSGELLAVLWTTIFLGCGCEADNTVDGSSQAGGDGDTDTDTDTDTGQDTGGDTDADADTDTDADDTEPCDLDLLFVIDNSGSMSQYQTALGLAFSQFTDALISTLDPDTNVHVGVTSTEMGYSSVGQSQQTNGQCTFIGDGGQSEDAFYITPDVHDTGRNGAQGRLFQPAGKPPFFAMDMGAAQAEVDELKLWFEAAAAVGTGGSNIEMLTAPVGWIDHPANSTVNSGFLRDDDTVLVVFFMQDEADQSPVTVGTEDTGEMVLQSLVDGKTQCGGLDCIVVGGFTDPSNCSGTRPINSFLDGLTRPHFIEPLPSSGSDAQIMADYMADKLTDALLSTIDDTCEEVVIIE